MIDAHSLDDLLADWHRWCMGYSPVSTHSASAMFQGVRSSRQWDTENEVVDGSLREQDMKALDFHIGELIPAHRTAIQINARNLVTGRSVWTSARLPQDMAERQHILRDARNALCERLG
jgi:hypothetical protein